MKLHALMIAYIVFVTITNAQPIFAPNKIDSSCVHKNIDKDGIVLVYVNNTNAIVGDMVLSESRNQIKARNSHGLIFTGLEVVACEEEEEDGAPSIFTDRAKYKKKKPFLHITRTADKIIVKTLLSYNCCQNIIADMKVMDEDRLDFTYHSYGQYCYYHCLREVTFTVDTEKVKKYVSDPESFPSIKTVSLQNKNITKVPQLKK